MDTQHVNENERTGKMPQNEGGTVTINKRTVGLVGAIALFSSIYPVFGVYVGFHEALATEAAETVMKEKITLIEGKIDKAQKTADGSAEKLTAVGNQLKYILVESSISAVAALKVLQDDHNANQQNTLEWRREKQRLELAVEKSILRRDCLLENRPDCDLLH